MQGDSLGSQKIFAFAHLLLLTIFKYYTSSARARYFLSSVVHSHTQTNRHYGWDQEIFSKGQLSSTKFRRKRNTPRPTQCCGPEQNNVKINNVLKNSPDFNHNIMYLLGNDISYFIRKQGLVLKIEIWKSFYNVLIKI